MMAPLHQDLRSAEDDRFLNFLVEFIERNHVGISVLFRSIKSAELAIDVADIGIIDVPIDNVRHDLVASSVISLSTGEFTAAIGQRAEFLERQRVQTKGLGLVDASTIPDFLQQVIQRGVVDHTPKLAELSLENKL